MNSYPQPNNFVASAPTMPQQQNNERLMTPASLIYPHLQQTVNQPQQYVQQPYNPQAQVPVAQVAQVAQVPVAPPTNFVDTESNIIHTNNLEPYIEGVVHNEIKKIYNKAALKNKKKEKEIEMKKRNKTQEMSTQAKLRFEVATQEDYIQMSRYAAYLGINISKYPKLIPIVVEAINAPLPPDWDEVIDDDDNVFYHNKTLNTCHWEHPLDPYYKKYLQEEKQKHKDSSCTIQ